MKLNLLATFEGFSLKKKLLVGFFTPLTFLVIISIMAFFSLNKLITSSHWVTHTYQAIALGNGVTSSLINMETGLRGYLISGKDNFLAPYTEGEQSFDKFINDAKSKVSDNPAQVKRLNQIEKIKNRWVAEHVNIAIDYRREVSEGENAARNFATISARTVGKEKFDTFRKLLGEIKSIFTKRNDIKGLRYIDSILIDMINQETGQRGFLLTGKDESLEPYIGGITSFESNSKKMLRHISSNYNNSTLEKMRNLVKQTTDWREKAADPEIEARREMNKVSRTINDVTVFIEKGIGKGYMDEMRGILNEFVSIEKELIEGRNKNQDSIALLAELIIVIGTLVALIFGAVVIVFLTRIVLKQLGADPLILKEMTERVASGDYSMEIPNDNITGVMKSMTEMRDQLSTASDVIERDVQSIVNSAKQGDLTSRIKLADKVGFYKTLCEGINELLDVNERVINDTSTIFESMAKGDLSRTIDNEYEGVFDKLKNNANLTIKKLTDVIETDIQNIIDKARDGDLSERITIGDKEGFFKTLSQGINELVDTNNQVVNDVSKMFGAMAQGDLSVKIDKNYKGSFHTLKEDANLTVDRLVQVIERDIQGLVNSAREGDLTQRINLGDKNGFFNTLSLGINELVDTSERVVNDVSEMFAGMAKGNLNTRIENDYQGSFNRLKIDANITVEKLLQVIEHDIQGLVKSAKNGDLTQRIELQDKEGFFKDLSQGINDLVAVNEQVLNDSSKIMSSMARGDLTQQITSQYEGSFDQLKTDSNSTLNTLIDIIDNIRRSADLVASGSLEIADGNNDLSERTEEQSRILESTTSSMQGITETVRESAGSAKEASKKATMAKNYAKEGERVVKEANDSMSEIVESSTKISNIITAIDDIAFQTNLLALNAAVEAARAGEQGRGFAVVAVEVRNLSQRSASAAKEIKELIEDSVEKAKAGSILVNNSAEKLNSIFTAIEEVADIIEHVDEASESQLSGIEKINKAIYSLEDMTQKNVALVEEAAASSTLMSNQANDMNSQLNFFSTENS